MPFVTKNPSYYISALEESSNTEPIHVGLYLAGNSINEDRARDLLALGKAIHQTPRPIRCLWLRFREGNDALLAALRAFGDALVGATAIQTLVFEGRVGTAEVHCLEDFFMQKHDLRGLQFRRTDVDTSTFIMLKPFFASTSTLKVLDMSSNPGVGDDCINDVLDSLLEGETKLETLNLGECNIDGQPDDICRVSGSGVASIASFVSKTPSLSSITLRLRHLDDIGLGEIAIVVRTKHCNVRRLDLSGNFGNSGVKIFAEALKTNESLKTVSFGCYKHLDDIGGQVLLNVVDPFSLLNNVDDNPSSQPTRSSEWENVKRSNHTLQSIYILDRPTVTMNKDLITKLQSISTSDAHHTLQKKVWHHIEKNTDGSLSHLGLETKHIPRVLSFVHQHGTIDDLFRLLKSRNATEVFTNPSPEKERLSRQMEKMEQENELLKKMLELEREKSEGLHEENNYLRHLFRSREEAKECCLLPIFKLLEVWRLFIKSLQEPALS